MADSKGKGKRRAEEDSLISNGSMGQPANPTGKKAKKRVRIGETEVFGGNFDDDVMGGSGKEVDDSEDLETAKTRRGAVKLDGYASESESSEDEDEAPLKSAEDDDMFGDSFEDKKKQPKRKKGQIKYMRSDEIEGQEFAPTEDYDEDGMKITPFNVDEEMEEGAFDESGNYIRKKDEHQMHDNWLQGVSKTDIEKAKAAHDRQIARANAQQALSDKTDTSDANQLWLNALKYLQSGETIFSAMQRWGGGKKAKAALANKWKKKKSAAMDVDEAQEDPAVAAEKKNAVEQLTALSDKLMSLGQFDFESLTYEQIVRNLRIANLLDDAWQPGDAVPEPQQSSSSTAPDTLWEYKWGTESEELFGPYTGQEMRNWNAQGFFKEGGAMVREVNATTSLDAMSGFVPAAMVFGASGEEGGGGGGEERSI
ncbi:hypothetical protein HK097_004428 [Rhizophlyctis rosea]|uniref:GYF domain-containing protein n=1 Tax=Rhizophlyctis rosea TaxID=64517 RepID=A0AAD5X762_9FUNG|nr:hypothetical protein HK097_004428 [Rhizophlyctis rosea]